MRKLILLSLGLLSYGQTHAQLPAHDRCEQALTIAIGSTTSLQDNAQLGVEAGETPLESPVTCIRTFENDLWYQFETQTPYHWYQVEIKPLSCATPAGIQALVIRSDNCISSEFSYQACSNPQETQNLNLVWADSVPGHRYLIYVDGYDGNVCLFTVSLKGHDRDPRSVEEISRQDMDYGMPPPSFEPEAFSVQFENNEAVVRWSAASQDGTQLFQVQRVWHRHGRLLGIVEARQTVGMEMATHYEFVDQGPFESERDYCYRIVRISARGEKAYAEKQCAEAQLMEDFFISPVFSAGEPGVYAINFINKKRQDLRFSVWNLEGEELKSMLRAKEPKGNGIITIDMNAYAPGTYFLRVEGKREQFRRRIELE